MRDTAKALCRQWEMGQRPRGRLGCRSSIHWGMAGPNWRDGGPAAMWCRPAWLSFASLLSVELLVISVTSSVLGLSPSQLTVDSEPVPIAASLSVTMYPECAGSLQPIPIQPIYEYEP